MVEHNLDNVFDSLTVGTLTVTGTEVITSVLQIPYGSRPGSPVAGDVIVNSGSNLLDWYDGTAWHTAADLTTSQTFLKGQTITSSTPTALTLNAQSGSQTGGAGTGTSGFIAGLYQAAGTVTFGTNLTGDFASNWVAQTTIAQNSAASVSNAASMVIEGAPIAGANFSGTATTYSGLWIKSVNAISTAGTISTASSLRIDGAPTSSGGTISTAYALFISSGVARIDSQLAINQSSASNAKIRMAPSTGVTGGSVTQLRGIEYSTSTVNYSTSLTGDRYEVFLGQTTLTATGAGTVIPNAATMVIDGTPIQSGANTDFTNAYGLWIKATAVSGTSGHTISNAASLLIDGAPTSSGTITNSYALWISGAGQVSRIDGTLVIQNNGTVVNGSALSFGTPSGKTGSASQRDLGFSLATGTTAFATSNQTGDFNYGRMGIVTITNPIATGTITNAATLKIDGAPVASTNTTIANSFALWVAGGKTRIDTMRMNENSSATNGGSCNIDMLGQAATGGSGANTAFLHGAASTINFGGGTAQTGDAYSVLIESIAYTATTASSVIPNAATMKLTAAPTASGNASITNAYTMWVAGGTTRLDGAQEIATSSQSGATGFTLTSERVLLFNSTAASQTVTLPAANIGKRLITIKNTGATNTFTVSRAGSDTIFTTTASGQTATGAIAVNGGTITLVSDGTSVWHQI